MSCTVCYGMGRMYEGRYCMYICIYNSAYTQHCMYEDTRIGWHYFAGPYCIEFQVISSDFPVSLYQLTDTDRLGCSHSVVTSSYRWVPLWGSALVASACSWRPWARLQHLHHCLRCGAEQLKEQSSRVEQWIWSSEKTWNWETLKGNFMKLHEISNGLSFFSESNRLRPCSCQSSVAPHLCLATMPSHIGWIISSRLNGLQANLAGELLQRWRAILAPSDNGPVAKLKPRWFFNLPFDLRCANSC